MKNWNEATQRKKTEYIIQDILKWVYFPTWNVMHTARWVLEHDESITYPYAFWSEQQEGVFAFYHEYEDAYLFDPLSNMNDAWKIIEWSMHLPGGLRWQFDHILEVNLFDAWKEDGYKPRLRLDFISKLTPEMLCKTAWNVMFYAEKEENDGVEAH